jgi:hypothetical protein
MNRSMMMLAIMAGMFLGVLPLQKSFAKIIVAAPETPVEITYDLKTGQDIQVGQVRVNNDGTYLTVTYQVGNPWELKEVHLAASCQAEDLPANKACNPIVGKFPFSKGNLDEGTTSVTLKIPLTELGDCHSPGDMVYIAAQAVVSQYRYGVEEAAWGVACNCPNLTFRFLCEDARGRGNPATFFPYTIQSGSRSR